MDNPRIGFSSITEDQQSTSLSIPYPVQGAGPAQSFMDPNAVKLPAKEAPRLESHAFLPARDDIGGARALQYNSYTLPWLGLGALAASALSVFLSLAVLILVDNHVVWSNTGWAAFMRPASWLSILLSANAVFLHFAQYKAFENTWWVRATKPQATVQELHDTWRQGTSLPAALAAGRRTSFISVVTIFCALLPLNAFLLQGAISTILSEERSNTTVYIPMVKQLPSAYSGYYIAGKLNYLETSFDTVWQQIINLEASPNTQYAFAGTFVNGTTYWDWGCENSSICTTTALGVGFYVACEHDIIQYDLLPRSYPNATKGRIFWSTVGYNPSEPASMTLDIGWKVDKSCIGVLQHDRCSLTAALVEYPVQIQMNISSQNVYPGPYVSLIDGTKYNDDKVHALLPSAIDDGIESTIYGGIAAHFASYYNAEMNVTTYPNGTFDWDFTGQLVEFLSPVVPYGGLDGYFSGGCNTTFVFGLEEVRAQQLRDGKVLYTDVEENIYNNVLDLPDPADLILAPLRRAMFLASVYEGFAWFPGIAKLDLGPSIVGNDTLFDDYVQTRPGIQVKPVSRYTVRFYLWGASLATTYLVILFIIPLFWGFWTIRRKPTMSPIETARLLKAPLLGENDDDAMEILMTKHGRYRVHYELLPGSHSSDNKHAFDGSAGKSGSSLVTDYSV